MIQTQFQGNVKVFKSANGKEFFFKKNLGRYFLENGFVHQSSCNDTPQQNGVVEKKKKNKHLLKVDGSLLFSTKILKYLWGEAILATTYLINKMPT